VIFDAPWPTHGIRKNTFLLMKCTLEFSWLRITSPDARKVFRRNEYERWQREAALQSPALTGTKGIGAPSTSGL
jgi:hypothetical protein